MPGAMRRRLRRLDLEASRRPDAFVAISGAVRDRIRRFYGREADVIHPPVDVDDFFPTREKEPARFLWAHRFVSYKRPEIVVEAFRGLPYRLTMIGVGPLAARLERDLPANVEILSWLPRRQLVRRFEEASGFLHIAEEDFGITMVEALAAGTPVVALGAGGALDIIRNGLDGILVDRPEVEQVRDAVRRLASREWDRGELAARAQEFSRLRFVERLSARVSELAEARGLYP
jgi:glycosyltransferase involved in cell wall biosynthesis